MTSRTYTATLDGGHIPVPFDCAEAFGKARPAVTVSLNGFTYRSTVAIMGGERFLPLRKSNREAAGLNGDETLEITIALDDAPRTVDAPDDLAEALRVANAWIGWGLLSYSHQREYVEAIKGAKRPETRARRIELAVEAARKRAL